MKDVLNTNTLIVAGLTVVGLFVYKKFVSATVVKSLGGVA